ncbi:Unknown protein sequence [Pseudomonas syringae pv. maculicola]|uniref:Uncharacterized protein n=2 Tax=Pseudomonas savastanoi TaxID=29438 RepID=A0A3M3GBP8_PSESG|nr:Unknown protein sequence [Pseudomonas savastanoi pv. phaseolicola]KPB65933.1 Unknown protein sequence [Pseudomonas amygdali pv. mellea]KPB86164.1 Unknown protein sequence [Pseudomonas syringae pv. maculicola]RMM71653.1 hypothetical protein ALQ73_101963 [Pseudomonas savastanoi pv. glycinea]KPB48266.1 Unknown protein sequence [Pseudomonas savastanoi pv. phaseolicola]
MWQQNWVMSFSEWWDKQRSEQNLAVLSERQIRHAAHLRTWRT